MSIKANNERLERIIIGQERLMEEVHGILRAEEGHDALLRAAVRTSRGVRTNHVPEPEPHRVFTRDEIRAICVQYRLRFLDAGRFKGELPPQAVHAIRRLEARTSGPLLGFKVMAPAVRFQLRDCESDPLLFVPLDGDRFFLVHRWGGDLSPWRKVLHWWSRSPHTLVASLILIALVATGSMPTHLITAAPDPAWWGGHRFLCFFHVSMILAAFTVFGWFAFNGKFSTQAWDDPTFN